MQGLVKSALVADIARGPMHGFGPTRPASHSSRGSTGQPTSSHRRTTRSSVIAARCARARLRAGARDRLWHRRATCVDRRTARALLRPAALDGAPGEAVGRECMDCACPRARGAWPRLRAALGRRSGASAVRAARRARSAERRRPAAHVDRGSGGAIGRARGGGRPRYGSHPSRRRAPRSSRRDLLRLRPARRAAAWRWTYRISRRCRKTALGQRSARRARRKWRRLSP